MEFSSTVWLLVAGMHKRIVCVLGNKNGSRTELNTAEKQLLSKE